MPWAAGRLARQHPRGWAQGWTRELVALIEQPHYGWQLRPLRQPASGAVLKRVYKMMVDQAMLHEAVLHARSVNPEEPSAKACSISPDALRQAAASARPLLLLSEAQRAPQPWCGLWGVRLLAIAGSFL